MPPTRVGLDGIGDAERHARGAGHAVQGQALHRRRRSLASADRHPRVRGVDDSGAVGRAADDSRLTRARQRRGGDVPDLDELLARDDVFGGARGLAQLGGEGGPSGEGGGGAVI